MHTVAQQVPAFIQSLSPFIHRYGYLGVGGLITLEDLGLFFIPGETVLITAAFFAGLGHLNIFIIFIVGVVGAIIGDNIGFAIGDFGGRSLVERIGRYVFLTPERIKKAEMFFNRNGGKVVIVARFIDGLRQTNGIIAGISEMKWLKFLLFNSIGAILWVGLWSSVGYFGGSNIETFLRYDLYITALIILSFVLLVSYKLLMKKYKKTI